MYYIGTGCITNHLKSYHKEVWAAYHENRTMEKEKNLLMQKEEEKSNEMANSSVRFFYVRTNGGRQSFLQKASVFVYFNWLNLNDCITQ